MIRIDGSTLEGGGQLTRLSLCLSAITRTPVHIYNIRANRSGRKSDGGLKESHLAALHWLVGKVDADVEGAKVGSREVQFRPGRLKGGSVGTQQYESKGKGADARVADVIELEKPGSVWLIWQAIYPFLVFGHYPGQKEGEEGGVEIVLRGGTNVDKSMSAEYVMQVFVPICERIGLPRVEVEVVKRGWAGGVNEIGEVRLRMKRVQGFVLKGFEIVDRGEVCRVDVSVIANGEMGQVIVEGVKEKIKEVLGEQIEVNVLLQEDSGDDRKLYVLLVAHTTNGWRLGRDFLGGKKPKNESEKRRIAENAVCVTAKELVKEVKAGGCVDEFMEDQLVVFQALAEGHSRVESAKGRPSTLHTQTVKWVSQEILRKKGVGFQEDGGCEGIGWNGDREADSSSTTLQTDEEIINRVSSLNLDT